MKKTILYLFSLIALGALMSSCEDKIDDTENVSVNTWILSQMRTYYLWTDNLPSKPSLTPKPEDFFESILYKSEDRFSWIQNATELQNSLNGVSKATGFEMILYKTSETSSNLIGQILYVFPNTPASRAGLKRGDLFTKVNNQTLTLSNYYDLLFGANSSTQNIGFVTYSKDNGFVNSKTVSIVTEEITEDPIMIDSVYNLGGKKIGYFAYKNFIPDPGDKSLVYDKKIDNIFAKFKSQAISELVLDLRLNTGGAVTSAVKLASLIVKNATSNDVLLRQKYNNLLTNEIRNEEGDKAFYTNFSTQANNVGSTISKLVVLTGKHTASASELIINGLRPYMQVVLVGDTTYGKNVGSITITDDTKKISWGIQPIIVKIYNAKNESDYTNGFIPTIPQKDNSLILYPFGDLREPLLRTAITKVYGIELPAIPTTSTTKALKGRALNEIANSVSYRLGAYTTSMDR